MHITFPSKIEKLIQYMKLKMLPNTLFFRTMLLIFIPLISLQVAVVVAFLNGNWEKVGKRLSDNLSNNIASAIEIVETNPVLLPEIEELYKNNYKIKMEKVTEENKLSVKTNTHYGKDYKIVTGFLEYSLHE